jgi:hypothetical protein
MRWQSLLLAAAFTAAALLAARAQTNPASLPARDSHQNLLIAVNPYLSADQYKTKFGKRTPLEAGVAALEVFFRNDNDSPIRIDLKSIRLIVGASGDSRQRLEALSPEEVADRILLRKQSDPTQRRPPLPLPGAGVRPNRDKNWQELDAVLGSAAMSTDLLPPHATTRGFFYFDLSGRFDTLASARLDVPDLVFMLDKKALFFFQVDLAPAIH